MAYKVFFRPGARDEAIAAAGYIADQGVPETAHRWFEGLESAIASLAEMPRRCARARENEAFPEIELRQLAFKSHRLIFTIRADEVHVLHIRHAARQDLESLDSERDQ